MSRTWKLILLFAAIAAAALLVVPWRANADGDSKAQAGLKLAQQFCVQCHMVASSSKQGWTDAPSFESIANRAGNTVPKLVAFIQQPHMHMLNTGRSPAEADEIATYIISLRKK
jgi:mono/diheme cytochrome c family protein